jgi:hypothetical protein
MTKTIMPCVSATLALFLMLAATGCDKKAATNSNFENGINHAFAKSPECLFTVYQKWPEDVWSGRTDYDALVAAGLLSKAETKKNTFRYDLTTTAKPSVKGADDAARLCYGFKKVDEILNFTEPSDSTGAHVSAVTYTWKLVDVSDWARNAEVQKAYPQLVDALKDDPSGTKRKSQEAMILTHQGWRTGQDQ